MHLVNHTKLQQMEKRIKDLIGQNKLGSAIELMDSFLTNAKHKKELTLIASRLNAVNEKLRLGVISENESTIELNKIRSSLIDLCNSNDTKVLESRNKSKNLMIYAALGLFAVLASSYFFVKSKSCGDRRVAVKIADFQNKDKDTHTDGFTNSLITRITGSIDNKKYDVSAVGLQPRVSRYDEVIKERYFDACDTSGVFINGYMSKDEHVFNSYINIVNLNMQSQELLYGKPIVLDNPHGFEFNIPEDAKLLSDFVISLIKCYEGKTLEALKELDAIQNNEKIKLNSDNNFKATIAHYKGNCYALRGDNTKANHQYDLSMQYGNSEMKEVSSNNKKQANDINSEYKKDPKKLNDLLSEHAIFDKDVMKAIDKVGDGLSGALSKLFSK
jgi:hypothetical protein